MATVSFPAAAEIADPEPYVAFADRRGYQIVRLMHEPQKVCSCIFGYAFTDEW